MDLVHGIAFRGYRSFSSDQLAILDQLSKINLIVGRNNSGKSNILRMIHSQLGAGAKLRSIDRPHFDATHDPSFMVAVSTDQLLEASTRFSVNSRVIAELLEHPRLSQGLNGAVWMGVHGSGKFVGILGPGEGAPRHAEVIARSMLNAWSTNNNEENTRRVLTALAAELPRLPPSVYVEGSRAISDENDSAPDLNGLSIKRRLSELQNPTTEKLEDRRTFTKIQDFVRTVLDDAELTIDVPHDLSTIHVTQGGKTLPIENLGTGVHEVVILAAAATITTDSVMCIEEPEVHMHPLLQRQLLRYLSAKTSNQYFIATHSAHLLDAQIGSIYHVRHDLGTGSTVRRAGTSQEHASVASDLGYRPSDLVQSNAVIWVEGPSDRLYIKRWIDALAPGRFVEGLHYSVMFYGGSLLSELSPLDSDEVDEFISLRRLNRNMVVVIDSDKTSPRRELNQSKRRVIDSLNRSHGDGLAWVTAGYTIENYVPQDLLDEAVRAAHSRKARMSMGEMNRWANPLSEERTGVKHPSKVAIAKLVTERWGDDWPLRLKSRMNAVIALIERANSHLAPQG